VSGSLGPCEATAMQPTARLHCVAAAALGSCVALLLCRCCKTGQQSGADHQKLELTALPVIVYQPASSMSAWSALELSSCRVAFAGLIVGYLAVVVGWSFLFQCNTFVAVVGGFAGPQPLLMSLVMTFSSDVVWLVLPMGGTCACMCVCVCVRVCVCVCVCVFCAAARLLLLLWHADVPSLVSLPGQPYSACVACVRMRCQHPGGRCFTCSKPFGWWAVNASTPAGMHQPTTRTWSIATCSSHVVAWALLSSFPAYAGALTAARPSFLRFRGPDCVVASADC
jgi:hypothetical protein